MAPNRKRMLGFLVSPEWALFPTEEARKAVEEEVLRMGSRNLAMWGRAGIVFAVVFVFVLGAPACGLTRGSVMFYAMEGLLVLAAAAWLSKVAQRETRPFIRRRLLEFGIPVCARCCYNLTGNTSGVCPECGTPIPDDIRELIADSQTELPKQRRGHMVENRVPWPRSWLYPELKLLPTAEARRQAGRKANKIILASPFFWLTAITAGVTVPAIIFFLQGHTLANGTAGLLFRVGLAFACSLIVGVVPILYLSRRVRPFLRTSLLEIGIPVCARCCYNLTGNTSGVCPECGTRIPEEVRHLISKQLNHEP